MALTKVKGSGVEGITNLSNATFLSVDASEVATLLTTAVINSEGGAATTNIAQGLAKSWVNFDGSISTLSARDSFNVSSLVDNGTGNHDQVFTNNMGSVNYSVSGAIADNSPISSNRNNVFQAVAESASQINLNCFGSDQADMNHFYGQAHGDLA